MFLCEGAVEYANLDEIRHKVNNRQQRTNVEAHRVRLVDQQEYRPHPLQDVDEDEADEAPLALPVTLLALFVYSLEAAERLILRGWLLLLLPLARFVIGRLIFAISILYLCVLKTQSLRRRTIFVLPDVKFRSLIPISDRLRIVVISED